MATILEIHGFVSERAIHMFFFQRNRFNFIFLTSTRSENVRSHEYAFTND